MLAEKEIEIDEVLEILEQRRQKIGNLKQFKTVDRNSWMIYEMIYDAKAAAGIACGGFSIIRKMERAAAHWFGKQKQ